MKTIRRVTTIAAVLAATGALGITTAAPASAEVSSKCGQYICVYTAHQGNDYVQDVTVRTRDGLPGTLRVFVGNFRSSKANVASYRAVVNREFAAHPLVCGGLDRGGRFIENRCVRL